MPALDTLTFDSLIGKLTGEAEELTDMERETFDLIGPVAIQKGDVVCVLNHAKTAQILRPRRDMDREVYILVD